MKINSTSLTISNADSYIHEEAKIISKKAKTISSKLGIVDEELYEGHSSMTNFVYINTPIEKMVNIVVNYDVFYFLDDFFGEDTNTGELPEMKKILDIWNGKSMHKSDNIKINKLYDSIDYISTTLRKDSPDDFFKKYTNSVLDHLSASLTKKPYNSVNEYISIRLITGGMYLLIDLIEYVHSIYLNNELLNNKDLHIQKLCEQCALIGALSNDIFSYAKEKHSDYNLINAYLKTKEAPNYNQAVIKSIDKVNDIHSEFTNTLKKARTATLSAKNNLIMNKYFDSLEVIVSSSYHWQKSTKRYYHLENIFEDMKHFPSLN